jgi:hypothetical protein
MSNMAAAIAKEWDRSAEGIHNMLKKGVFNTAPGDVFTIETVEGMISSTLFIHLTNEEVGTDTRFGLKNCQEVWEWLKSMNEMGGRQVLHKHGKADPVAFEDSPGYKIRF